MKYKTLSVRVDKDMLEKIKELQNHEFLKKWEPSVSDIFRVALYNYWEDMCCKPEEDNVQFIGH